MPIKNLKNKIIVFASDDKKFPVINFLDSLSQEFEIIYFQDIKFHKKFSNYCSNNNINYLDKYDTNRLSRIVKENSVEVGIVMSFNKILDKSVIDLFSGGLINAHPSLLPELRGRTPVESTILLDLKYLGFTTMLIDNGVDSGPILSQYSFDRLDNNLINTRDCYNFIANTCSYLFTKTIADYLSNKLTPTEQHGKYSVSLPIKKQRIDLSELAQESELLYRTINALDIEPRSFITYNNLELLINKVIKVSSDEIGSNELDSKIGVINKRLYLKTDDGLLEILEIQPKDGKSMRATDFINGYLNNRSK